MHLENYGGREIRIIYTENSFEEFWYQMNDRNKAVFGGKSKVLFVCLKYGINDSTFACWWNATSRGRIIDKINSWIQNMIDNILKDYLLLIYISEKQWFWKSESGQYFPFLTVYTVYCNYTYTFMPPFTHGVVTP